MNALKLFAAAVAALVVLASPLNAQSEQADRKAFHQEVQTYVHENVFPVLKPKRQALEGVLSPEEKAKIQEIRSEFQAHRTERENRRIEGGKMPAHPGKPDETQMSQMKALHDAHQANREAIHAIAEKHQVKIDQLLGEVKPQQEKWKTDIQAIAEKHGLYPPQKPTSTEGFHPGKPGGGRGPGHGPHGAGHGPHGGRGLLKIMQPVGFLLWDADAQMPIIPEDSAPIRTFPNPTSGQSTLEYQVTEPGIVTIHILNEKGLVVKTLRNETQTKGSYQIQTDVSDLEKGMYFYQIKTPSGLETQKLIINP